MSQILECIGDLDYFPPKDIILSIDLYWYLMLQFVSSNVVSLELVINLEICLSFALQQYRNWRHPLLIFLHFFPVLVIYNHLYALNCIEFDKMRVPVDLYKDPC